MGHITFIAPTLGTSTERNEASLRHSGHRSQSVVGEVHRDFSLKIAEQIEQILPNAENIEAVANVYRASASIESSCDWC